MTNKSTENPSNKEGETDTKSTESATVPQNQQGREREEKEESSTSTGSDGGKGNSSGSGSGGGYNADCSSSDSSSTRVAEKEKTKANANASTATNEGNDMGGKVATSKTRTKPSSGNAKTVVGIGATSQSKEVQSDADGRTRYSNLSSQNSSTNNNSDTIRRRKYGSDSGAKKVGLCLPQWNGVTVEHPMDPRIDLSTVGFSIGSSNLAPFANDINSKSTSNFEAAQNNGPNRDINQMASSYAKSVDDQSKKKELESSAVPSPEQYTKLLEVSWTFKMNLAQKENIYSFISIFSTYILKYHHFFLIHFDSVFAPFLMLME